MDKKTEALKLALNKVQEFKSRWCKVPPFADRVNKATRDAITLAQVPIFELEHALREALAEQPAQQEPVAWDNCRSEKQCRSWCGNSACGSHWNDTSPPPCPTCEALARTVMLDQTSHDAQRKPTDEMVVAAARVLSDRQAAACNVDCGDMWKLHGNDFIDDARAALEAAHGIREKNT